MSQRKSEEDRANRIKPVYPDLPLYADGQIRGPNLPEGVAWCERTKAWWMTIRRSAQAQMFEDTDWLHLLDTALIHNKLWGGTAKPTEMGSLASEVRRRTESYGFTWADRRKYGFEIIHPDSPVREAERATKESAVDYRKRLNGLA